MVGGWWQKHALSLSRSSVNIFASQGRKEEEKEEEKQAHDGITGTKKGTLQQAVAGGLG